MRVTIAQAKGDAVVLTEIYPTAVHGNLHTIKITRRVGEKRQISKFFVDSELDAWHFISILCLEHRLAADELIVAIPDSLYAVWEANKCEELYAK